MSIKNMLNDIAGHESMNVIAEPSTTPTMSTMEVALAVVDADVANAEKDVAETIGNIDLTLGNTEQLEEKIADLADATAGMESMISGGTPFNSGLFAHYYKTATKIANTFGGNIQHQGAESFENKDGLNTEIIQGVESFKDIGKKAVGKVKELFIELYNRFLSLFDNFIQGYGAMAKQAKALGDHITGKMTFPSDINLPAACNYADNKGEVSDVVQLVIGMVNGLKGMASTSHSDDIKKAVDFALDGLGTVGKKTVIGHDTEGNTYEVTFNKAHFKYTQPSTEKSLSSMNLFDVGAESEGQTVKGLNGNQLKSLAKSVESMCDKLSKIDLSRKGLTTIRDHAIYATEKGMSNTQYLTDAHKGMLKLCRGASEIAVKSIKAQLAFIRAHIQASTSVK